jgi:hypothetical protein
MPFHIEDLNQNNASDWEALNQRSGDGSVYHTLRWKDVLERSFGIKSHYFIIYEKDRPIALCPFFEKPLRGLRSLVPPPSTDLNNVIVTDPSNKSTVRDILLKSIDVAKKNRLAFIIMVSSKAETADSIQALAPFEHKKAVPFPVNGYLRLDLREYNPSYIWDKVFTSKKSQKKYIRRFEQSGYEFRDSKDKKDIDHFYRYYTLNLNHIGATPFDRSHFDVIFDTFQNDELRLTLLEKGDEVAGGLLALQYPQKNRMYLKYMAINRDIPNTFHPPYALYWDAINYAFNNGYDELYFGTNTNDPTDKSFRIKKEFGCSYCNSYGVIIPMNRLYGTLYWASRFFKGRIRNKLAAE